MYVRDCACAAYAYECGVQCIKVCEYKCVHTNVRKCMCACVYVCVRERERERECIIVTFYALRLRGNACLNMSISLHST